MPDVQCPQPNSVLLKQPLGDPKLDLDDVPLLRPVSESMITQGVCLT